MTFNKKPGILQFLLISAAAISASDAATVYAVGNSNSSQSWNTGSLWSDGNGVSSGNDYVIGSDSMGNPTGFEIRTPNDSGNTNFPAMSTLTITDTGRLVFKNGNGTATFNFPSLILQGGSFVHSGGGDSDITIAGNIEIAGGFTSSYVMSGASGRDFDLTALLTGSGTLQTTSNDRNLILDNAASTFSGLFDITTGNLGFAQSHSLSASLALSGSGQVVLTQNVSFSSLSINGDIIGEGTYTEADLVALNAAYDPFVGGDGTSTITVVPEPTSGALLLLSAAAFFRRRR